MGDAPRYMVFGGGAFDDVAEADNDVQLRFLKILVALRRDPRSSPDLDIEAARAWSGDKERFMARLENVDVSYEINENPLPFVSLISVIWL